jgi:hypothetical protein
MKNFKSVLILFVVISVSMISCGKDDPCDGRICEEGQVLDALSCVCVTLDQCESVICASGEIKTADCDCVTQDPCASITCASGEICEDGTCVEDPNALREVTVAGFVNDGDTWTSDNIYIMTGKVVVPEGATLTIEPGTIIKGAEGEGTLASALVVARGARLIADGTAEDPIIFTSVRDNIRSGQIAGTNLDETQVGLWGGLIILGNAPVSVEAGLTSQIEGIPASDTFGVYGGNNPTDDSGVIRYVSIRHGGATIGEGNEINGITFGGVGSGTIVENIEIVGNQDDGLEWFGGTVNVSNSLVWAQGDDAYDIDQAYSGTIDNYIYIAGPDSDHGLEIDGPEGAANANGRFTMRNGTLKGLFSEYADFRDNAQGTIENSYFFNFPENADIELDDNASSANYFANILVITGNEFNTSHLTDGNRTIEDIVSDKSDAADEPAFDAQMSTDNNIVTTPSVGADTSVFQWTYAMHKGAISN